MIAGCGIKHVAVIWLKDPSSVGTLERAVQELATIPHVQEIAAGPPLATDWGRAIDTSYHYAFVAGFKTIDDCRAYFECDLHQRVAAEISELAERVHAVYVSY